MKIISILMFVLVLFSNPASCNDKKDKEKNNTESLPQETLKSTYDILYLNETDVSKENLYITFDQNNNRASGFSGCNTFSSTYTTDDTTISFKFPIATKMYCEKKAALEQEFFKVLLAVEVKNMTNDTLVLQDKNGKNLLLATQRQKN
ncbi:META domain-containing protein [Aquimarina sp. U1-2]|uniref:META domain-containing protein n=1 Tax=Aquimarina sp. U1-2 TaxID=2823141 RepID=UPI001AECF5BC|nr:META domain-containing protein [Aquimarina sp. U1-2]MBP2831595.1 META domain-containing protein [Aquimarina sp. U1-2]